MTGTPKNIDATSAVKTAYEYLIQVSPTANKFSNFRLEEIQQDKVGNHLIILSYDVAGEFGFDKQREYKNFKVTKDGNVEWMKIHKL